MKPILVIALALSTHAVAAEWKFIGTEGDATIYVDRKGFHQEGNLLKAWTRYDYAKPENADAQTRHYARKHELRYFSCSGRAWGLRKAVTYSEDGQVAQTETDPSPKLVDIVPDSLAKVVLDFVCDHQNELLGARAVAPSRVEATPGPVAVAPPPPMTRPRASMGYGDDGAREKFALEIARQVGLQAQQDRDYPRLARQRGWEGTTQVSLQFGADGKVRSVLVGESSGYNILDDKAIEMVRRVQMPSMPDTLRGQEFTVRVPIVFGIKRKS